MAWSRKMRVWKLTGSGTRMLVYNCSDRFEAIEWVKANGVPDGTYEVTEVFVWG